jgi:hypothetical protein
MLFRFQRKVNRLAQHNRATLEKYLGDGAFYSCREAHHLVILALQIQRAYREALARGFPFSKGLRIALNHGQYRLLPIQMGSERESERYEFFGHGVVELTRLTTGKGNRDIEELKTMLIAFGYPEATVNRFFAPMVRQTSTWSRSAGARLPTSARTTRWSAKASSTATSSPLPQGRQRVFRSRPTGPGSRSSSTSRQPPAGLPLGVATGASTADPRSSTRRTRGRQHLFELRQLALVERVRPPPLASGSAAGGAEAVAAPWGDRAPACAASPRQVGRLRPRRPC